MLTAVVLAALGALLVLWDVPQQVQDRDPCYGRLVLQRGR